MEKDNSEQLKVFDKNNCLKVDIDNIKDFNKVVDIISKRKFIFKRFKINPIKILVFATTKGYHIYFEFNSEDIKYLDMRDIIFMQLVLGSDNQREVFNWLRMKADLNWNILFYRKFDKDGNLVSQEVYNEEYSKKLFDEINKKEVMKNGI